MSSYQTNSQEYPYTAPSYSPGFDDAAWVQRELRPESETWRSEKWPADSRVLILDHNHGKATIDRYNDAGLAKLLEQDSPQVRFILLTPTNQEKVLGQVGDSQAAQTYYDNELLDDPKSASEQSRADSATAMDATLKVPSRGSSPSPEPKTAAAHTAQLSDSTRGNAMIDDIPSLLDISRAGLLKVLTKYDIAPAACSHIRGQEQIFGSRVSRDKNENVTSFEFWYAIRARSYFPIIKNGKEADLKMTIISRHDVGTSSTVILLKYRSYNDLTERLKRDLIAKLKSCVHDPSTTALAADPFALPLWHFHSAIQYYRRAARMPRDSIRAQERNAHGGPAQLAQLNIQQLHLALGSLDQDKIQMSFLIDTLRRLRGHHDLFYRLVRRVPEYDRRGGLHLRVAEEMDRYEYHLAYFKASVEDVLGKGQRLLSLFFNMQSRMVAEQTYRQTQQAMTENLAMRTIAVMTMLFLPGSFVASILGTNFFSGPSSPSVPGEDRRLLVSSQWWILLAATIPLTVLTFVVWYVWQRRLRRSQDVAQRLAHGQQHV